MRFQLQPGLSLQSLGGKTGSGNPAKEVEVGPDAPGVGMGWGRKEIPERVLAKLDFILVLSIHTLPQYTPLGVKLPRLGKELGSAAGWLISPECHRSLKKTWEK